MRKLGVLATLLAALSATTTGAQETTVRVDRGLTDDRPYTLIYPDEMTSVDDGSAVTVATLKHPNATLQCDAMIADNGPSGWAAETALAALDKDGTEQGWINDFPGFAITSMSITQYQSGPALIYEGESSDSPFGVPLSIVHTEAVDSGRTYIFECLVDRSIAGAARPLIDFLVANFSTRSDGVCCIDPAANP